jgi:hypothetical protein
MDATHDRDRIEAPTNDPLPMRTLVPVGIALLGPSILWALHLSVSYFLVQPVCVMGGEIALHIVSVAAVLLLLIPLILSVRMLASHGAMFRENLEGRESWLAFVGLFGVLGVLLFGIGIISQWVPMFVLDPCGVNAP